MPKLIKNKTITWGCIIYIIANISLIFVHGIFWDDWVIYESPIGCKEITEGIGATWQYPIIMGLMNFSHHIGLDMIMTYRYLIFILGLLNVILYYKILRNLNFPTNTVHIITLLFAAWPLGYTHMFMSCFFYQVGLFFLILSILLFIKEQKSPHVIFKITIFISVFLSNLFLQSTIVFWFGFLFLMAIYKTWNDFSFKKKYYIKVIKQNVALSLYFAPSILYWIVKNIFWKSSSVYASSGYNEFSLNNILRIPINFFKSITETISFYFEIIHDIFSSNLILLLLIILGILLIINRNFSLEQIKTKKNKLLIIIFSSCYFFSILAYLTVGKVQVFNSVDDRHGILIPIGLCPLIYYFLLLILKKDLYRLYSLLFITATFITYSINQYSDAILQSQKNDAIIHLFKTTDMKSGNIIIPPENPKFGDVFYTWAGLYKIATGKQDKCFYGDIIHDTAPFLKEMYNQKDAKAGKPTGIIYFMNSYYDFNLLSTYKRLFLYYTNSDKYIESLKKSFKIHYVEIY